MGSDEKVTDRAELDRRAVVIGGGTALIGLGLLTAACGTTAGCGGSHARPQPRPAARGGHQPRADASRQRGRGPEPGRAAGCAAGQSGGCTRRRGAPSSPPPRSSSHSRRRAPDVGLSAICTHMGCTVRNVSGGTINCPCHGTCTTSTGPWHEARARALAHRSATVVDGDLQLG